MQLKEIVWPVYSLKTFSPIIEENVSYYVTKDSKSIEIVDDKNVPGDNLSKRRLLLRSQKVNLFIPKYALFFIADLIKFKNRNIWFIDSSGKIFQYKKHKIVPLIFRKITNTIKTVGATLIEVEGISTRFKSLYPPTMEQKYAGLLRVGTMYLLYGFFDQQYKNTVRKI